MVPLADEDDYEGVKIEKIAAERPDSVMSEFYRHIRTNLLFMAPTGELKSLLVTSSSADCGKTTTAVNLAITLAGEQSKVLLVDANFRRPALGKVFGEGGSSRGLANILVGQAQASDVIRASGVGNLDVLDCGPLPPNPAELLNNKMMRSFMAEQKDRYDYVIIDGPPSLVVTDARILASEVDGTILVARAGKTARGMAQRMIRELGATTQSRILGMILNGVEPRRGGYFEEAYQSYYEYGKQKE